MITPASKPQLHWSHISMFTKCPEQYRRRYIEGEILPPGVGAVSGTGLHKAAELDLRHKMENGELAPEEAVTEAARDSVAKSFEAPMGVMLSDEERAEGEGAVRAKVIDTAVACAALYHAELAPQTAPKMVERKWVVEVKNFPFDLAGTIDCDEGEVIWDWKTSKQTPAADEADMSGQITMYSLAKYAHDKVLPTARLGYVVKNKTPKAMVLESRRTTNDFAVLRNAMERIAQAIDKEVFTFAAWMAPRPWWCNPKWCGYYDDCPGVSNRAFVFTGE